MVVSDKRLLRHWLTAALLCVFLMVNIAVPAFAQTELPLMSEAAILIDADSGQIVYEKNCHQKMYPASITKVLTGLIAIRELDPKQELTVSKEAVNAVPRTSSHIGLKAGEKITVEQALYALAMESANDAANVLAEAVSGSMEAFALKMNEEARAMGAEDTNFTNASGLPDVDHVTTACDMALITVEALKNPDFVHYFSTVNYEFPATNKNKKPRIFVNPNQILSGPYYYDGVIMGKTGYTTAALGTLVTAAKQGETTLIAVVMKSQYLESKYDDAWTLFNYGFFQNLRATVTGEEIAEQLNIDGYIPTQGQQFSFLLPPGSDVSGVTYSSVDNTAFDPSQPEVAVAVSYRGQQLPEITLKLEKKQMLPVEQAENTVLETISAQNESAPKTVVTVAICSGVLLLALGAEYVWRTKIKNKKQSIMQ